MHLDCLFPSCLHSPEIFLVVILSYFWCIGRSIVLWLVGFLLLPRRLTSSTIDDDATVGCEQDLFALRR